MIKKIVKRDGRIVKFDSSKIMAAIEKACEVTQEDISIGKVTDEVVKRINANYDNKENL